MGNSGAAEPTPVRVTMVQQQGTSLQLRIRVRTGAEPVLAWAGAVGPGPYPLSLIWSDVSLSLETPLPATGPAASGPLLSMTLRSVGGTDRLDLQLREPVYPKLRRIGDTWLLQLDPAPAVQLASATPSATGSEPLFVDLTVNGLRQADLARAEQLPDGKVLIARENWTATRLVPPAGAVTLADGTAAFPLDAVAGVRYTVDRQRMSIDVHAPPGAFVASSLDTGQPLAAAPLRPPPGALLNYDVSVARPASGGAATSGATLEAVGFGGFGTVVTSALASDDGARRRLVRLDSYWQYDMPESMRTLVVGDTISVGGGWSRPVRYAGVRWGSDFGLRPGFITMPLPALAGEAALPSTIDVLVNDSRRFSQTVRPGPFDITNVPVMTGSGELNLVVRDLLGRETVVSQSFYASPRLLAQGVADFSMEAGWLRTGFGTDSQYSDPFAAASTRRGMNPWLTVEGRLELQGERQAAGVELAGLLGTWGVGRVAVAASRDDVHGPAGQGQLVKLGVERSTPTGGGSLQYEYATRGFAPFGESADPTAVARRSREQFLASIGGRLWGSISGGLNYVRRVQWDGERDSSVGVSFSLPIGTWASLAVSATRRLNDGDGWSASVNLNIPLHDNMHAGARMERREDGQLAAGVLAVRNPPSGPGIGWRAEASTDPLQRARGGIQYNTNHGELAADVVADAQGNVSSRAGVRGTLGIMAGLQFASRPVGLGSFAVVEVEGMPGIPIKRANQVVAQTDSRGLAFVPGLLPWHRNAIEIDAADLPLDTEVQGVTQEVVPFARSGAMVRFEVRRSRQALLVLHQRNGQPVPIGSRVQLLPSGFEFQVARRGEVWLADLVGVQQRVKVSWDAGGCQLAFEVPASEDGSPATIGPLQCEGLHP